MHTNRMFGTTDCLTITDEESPPHKSYTEIKPLSHAEPKKMRTVNFTHTELKPRPSRILNPGDKKKIPQTKGTGKALEVAEYKLPSPGCFCPDRKCQPSIEITTWKEIKYRQLSWRIHAVYSLITSLQMLLKIFSLHIQVLFFFGTSVHAVHSLIMSLQIAVENIFLQYDFSFFASVFIEDKSHDQQLKNNKNVQFQSWLFTNVISQFGLRLIVRCK